MNVFDHVVIRDFSVSMPPEIKQIDLKDASLCEECNTEIAVMGLKIEVLGEPSYLPLCTKCAREMSLTLQKLVRLLGETD